MEFSENLKSALRQVSQEIAPDADCADGEEMAELCVDASRLLMAGHPEAQAEASSLISMMGYSEFLKKAAKYVSVY